jgi:hypothetical protein
MSEGVGERTWKANVETLDLEAREGLELEEEAITEYLT